MLMILSKEAGCERPYRELLQHQSLWKRQTSHYLRLVLRLEARKTVVPAQAAGAYVGKYAR